MGAGLCATGMSNGIAPAYASCGCIRRLAVKSWAFAGLIWLKIPGLCPLMKIPALERQDIVARKRPAGEFRREQVAAFAQPRQMRGQVNETFCNNMND